MNEINIKGSFLTLLNIAMSKHPNMTVGEILYSITNKKSLGKNMVEASDDELYTALEHFVKTYDPDDEPMDENMFIFWVDQRIICK